MTTGEKIPVGITLTGYIQDGRLAIEFHAVEYGKTPQDLHTMRGSFIGFCISLELTDQNKVGSFTAVEVNYKANDIDQYSS